MNIADSVIKTEISYGGTQERKHDPPNVQEGEGLTLSALQAKTMGGSRMVSEGFRFDQITLLTSIRKDRPENKA